MFGRQRLTGRNKKLADKILDWFYDTGVLEKIYNLMDECIKSEELKIRKAGVEILFLLLPFVMDKQQELSHSEDMCFDNED